MTHKEASAILDEFEQCFTNNPRIGQYFGATSLTTELMLKWEKTKGNLDKVRESLRKRGKDPTAWCIAVYLKEGLTELPEGVSLPASFKNLNVHVLPPMKPQDAY